MLYYVLMNIEVQGFCPLHLGRINECCQIIEQSGRLPECMGFTQEELNQQKKIVNNNGRPPDDFWKGYGIGLSFALIVIGGIVIFLKIFNPKGILLT